MKTGRLDVLFSGPLQCGYLAVVPVGSAASARHRIVERRILVVRSDIQIEAVQARRGLSVIQYR